MLVSFVCVCVHTCSSEYQDDLAQVVHLQEHVTSGVMWKDPLLLHDVSVNHLSFHVGIPQQYLAIVLMYVHTLSDNELPDYIMVMLANNKSVHQINNDLQLFLGENTDRFTTWLQRAIDDPAVLMETASEQREREAAEMGTTSERMHMTVCICTCTV